ncbi:MAG: DUF4430 domain-containing protein [Actinomycetota bacterium]
MTDPGSRADLSLEEAREPDAGKSGGMPPLDGLLVESINGSANGQGTLWWQYWVNDAYGDFGADRKVLSEGNPVLWVFRAYPPTGGV